MALDCISTAYTKLQELHLSVLHHLLHCTIIKLPYLNQLFVKLFDTFGHLSYRRRSKLFYAMM